MRLIGLFLGKLLTRGRLHLIMPDGTRESFGPGGGEEITVRLHDKRVALDIARDPKLAFGEAYVDGRLTIEGGDISQLLSFALGSARWEEGGGGRAALGGRRPGVKSLLITRAHRVSWRCVFARAKAGKRPTNGCAPLTLSCRSCPSSRCRS